MNSSLFSALKVERNVMFIILSLIIIVAAFNIISGLTILVKNKTRDIAILKSMGVLNKSIVKIFYVLLILMVLVKTLLSLYSFRWNIFDVGSYSSIVFNFSNGLNFNSFLQIPSTADHFTVSLAVFAPLYQIVATVHWLTFAKALSYLSVPLVVFFWLKNKTDNNCRFLISFLFGLWMLILYKPAVGSRFFEFSPSALAPPFIILSFLLMQKSRWFLFAITMLFLLGLKEHMGVILIGFGLYCVSQKNYRTGLIIAVLGFLITSIGVYIATRD